MTSSRGLPPGAQPWGRDVEAALARLKEIEEIARRICNDFGLDFSNPARGLSTGATPGVANPVQLKLPSLNDLDIRDAQDGDLLTFDGRRGKWVARRHDTVQLPKPVPVGDPDSYYVEPEEPPVETGVIPADTWSVPDVYHNVATNPGFEDNLDDWERAVGNQFDASKVTDVGLVREIGTGEFGTNAMRITTTAAVYGGDPQYTALWGVAIPVPMGTNYVRARMKYEDNAKWHVGFIFDTPGGPIVYLGYWDNFDSDQGSWLNRTHNLRYGPEPPEDATAMWVYVGGSSYRSLAGQPPSTVTVLVDSVFATGDQWDTYFDGNTVAYHTTYSWDGVANNSASRAVRNQRVFVPAVFPEGSEIEMRGEGYKPNSTALVQQFWEWGNWKEDIPVDASGNFATTLVVPEVGAPVTGNLWVYDSDWNGAHVQVTITPAEG